MGKKLERTAASQWRKQTEMVQMPSGNVAELQRINIVAMIAKNNDVPNFLLMKVSEQLNGQPKLKVLTPTEKQDESVTAKEGINAILWMARNVFVYPRLVDGDPQSDDEVCIDHISLEDLTFAANYAIGDIGMVNAVERFRTAQEIHVDDLSAVVSVGDETG